MDNESILERMNNGEYWYAGQDKVALQELQSRLRDSAKKRKLITYSDLVSGIVFLLPLINQGKPYVIQIWDWKGFDRKLIGDYLACASFHSFKDHGFMINALVVNKNEFGPNEKFVKYMEWLGVIPDLEELTILRFWKDHVNMAWDHYAPKRQR